MQRPIESAGPDIEVATLEMLKEKGVIVITEGEGPIAVFHHDNGEVHAVDNRCPHMGFPLHRGTVKDGILTCHWHHADFDLVSGCTFNLFADDVPTYPVVVRDGKVWLTPYRDHPGAVQYWKGRLKEGLEHGIGLVVAKAVIALLRADIPSKEIVQIGAAHGVRYRGAGWGPGLTILTAMANVLKYLPGDEQILPLYQGLVHVTSDSQGQSPRFDLLPLDTRALPVATVKRWFRHFVEVRDDEGANRCMLTAIKSGGTPEELVDMLMAAATDHFFLDGGHVADFINKASELLDLIGWENAGSVLPSLTSQLCSARRSEELNAWRHPIDLTAILRRTFNDLPQSVSRDGLPEWAGPAELAGIVLGEDPEESVRGLMAALTHGHSMRQVSQAVVYASALRVARFHTQNEFADWIGVLHTFTYCNAIHQAIKRTGSTELLRGVFHGAMRIYLDRFLNVPPAHLPGYRGNVTGPDGEDELLDAYLEVLNTQQQVEPAAKLVYRYLALGYSPERLFRTLADSLLREDAEFHSFQMLEAGIQQYEELRGTEEGNHVLIAVARYLAAHAPTQRSMNQTAQIALRLNRGESVYEES